MSLRCVTVLPNSSTIIGRPQSRGNESVRIKRKNQYFFLNALKHNTMDAKHYQYSSQLPPGYVSYPPKSCNCPGTTPQLPKMVTNANSNNSGRMYYGCPNFPNGGRFFEWVDDGENKPGYTTPVRRVSLTDRLGSIDDRISKIETLLSEVNSLIQQQVDSPR